MEERESNWARERESRKKAKLGTMLLESSLAKMASYLGSGKRNAREREEPPLSSPD